MRKRIVVIAAILAVALIGVGGVLLTRYSGGARDQLTVVSFGGAYQAAQRAAYMTPFAAQEKIRIVEGEYNGDYALLRERATSADGSWDVVSVESAPALRGEREGLFSPIPKAVYEGLPLVDSAHRQNAAGHLMFSTILAYRTDILGGKPNTWQDFWDVVRFPGKRGLRNNPRGTLEIALLADGVPADKLYPLDVERALRKLDQIRNQVVFWSSGAQPIQLLANKTVVMSSVYNGRIWDAQVKQGLPVKWSMQQGLLEVEYWAVPKNAPHKSRAFDFIRYSLQPSPQATFANLIAYIPTNLDAEKLIAPEVRSAQPDVRGEDQIAVNADWWADNEAAVSAKWLEWMAK